MLDVDSHIIKLFTFDLNQKKVVVGTDEAGRGPAAGGVFASAVCFKERSCELIEKLAIMNDSKQLSKKKREALFDIIKENTVNSTICVEVDEIEEINILNASLKAMKLACENVIGQLYPIPVVSDVEDKQILDCLTSVRNDENEHIARNILARNEVMVLIDGNKMIKDFEYSQKYVIKGDSHSASIAAASILAKVTRDRYMDKLDEEFPQYGWSKNAGYLTKEHIEAIDKYGLCKYHRPSFLKKHFAKQEQLSLF